MQNPPAYFVLQAITAVMPAIHLLFRVAAYMQLAGKRFIEITRQKTKAELARFIKQIADDWYKNAFKITLELGYAQTYGLI